MTVNQVADAKVLLVAYDPRWPELFESERALLQDLLAPWLVGGIEHIGSTAVPGLVAKPIIDIMAPVHDLETSRPAIAALQTASYLYAPYKQELMHWFCKPSPGHRTHHLHLVPVAAPLWRQRLEFRDALRRSEELRAEYAQLKRGFAAEFQQDREAYTDAKTSFVERHSAGAGRS